MERKLATIQIIKSLEPIEGADKIELAKFNSMEWQCVTQKGNFNVGDKCVYFEIDSVLPFEMKVFDFMSKYKYRLKTIKLKKTLSQGLIMPLSELGLIDALEEGYDVSKALGVTKYEPFIPESLRGKIAGNFPTSIIPKTDEERIQNCPRVLEKYAGKVFYITYKLDGCSSTYYLNGDHFGVCSRNMELDTKDENNVFVRIAKELDLETKLRNLGRNIALQGEICGPGIQKNPLGLKETQLFIYNAWDIVSRKYLSYFDFIDLICNQLGLKTVPIYSDSFVMSKEDNVDSILALANRNYPTWLVGPEQDRMAEGLVFRLVMEENDEDYLKGRVSFKAINNEYLLKHGE